MTLTKSSESCSLSFYMMKLATRFIWETLDNTADVRPPHIVSTNRESEHMVLLIRACTRVIGGIVILGSISSCYSN
jgi:hypothetical protein